MPLNKNCAFGRAAGCLLAMAVFAFLLPHSGFLTITQECSATGHFNDTLENLIDLRIVDHGGASNTQHYIKQQFEGNKRGVNIDRAGK